VAWQTSPALRSAGAISTVKGHDSRASASPERLVLSLEFLIAADILATVTTHDARGHGPARGSDQ
jgi:hypothetical protein